MTGALKVMERAPKSKEEMLTPPGRPAPKMRRLAVSASMFTTLVMVEEPGITRPKTAEPISAPSNAPAEVIHWKRPSVRES